MLKIRRAGPEEAETCWHIRNQAIRCGCRNSYDPVVLASWTPDEMPSGYRYAITTFPFFVAETAEGQLVATGFLDTDANSVEAMFTLPEHAGNGAGGQVMTAIKNEAVNRGISCLTLSSTPNARSFYEKHGFVLVRESLYPSALAGADLRCLDMESVLSTTT